MSKQPSNQNDKNDRSNWTEMTNPFRQLDSSKFPTKNELRSKKNGVILIPKK